MKRRPEPKQTFNSILGRAATENASRLMERASVANRLAKTVGGRARSRAYRVKTDALVNLSKNFPEQIFISNDPRTPRFVLVRNVRARFGLHAPAQHFVRRNG
jgi:hypothetical protein